MDACNHDEKSFLWIIRWQCYLASKFHSKIIASLSMFFMPVFIVGCFLQWRYDYELFSSSILLSLFWLAIAPYLIQNSLNITVNFFNKSKNIFGLNEEWEALRNSEIKYIQSSKYLVFGVPFAIITSLTILFTIFIDAPLIIKLWALISFFLLFLISSIGFQGIYNISGILNKVCDCDLIFNPYHPDKFGGISEFGSFAAKQSLHFSSGALIFPLVFDVVNNINKLPASFKLIPYVLVIFYVILLFMTFLMPIMTIKDFANQKKEQVILESREQLDRMIKNFHENKDLNIKNGLDILIHYNLNYSKLHELKDYPWDFQTLLQFSLSFAVPIGVTLIQINFK